jgi:hypothetical protein
VSAEPLRAVAEWLAPYRDLWESALDDLERHLDDMPDDRDPTTEIRRPREAPR